MDESEDDFSSIHYAHGRRDKTLTPGISLYQICWFSYLLPSFLIVGVIGNLLVLIIMSSKGVFVSSRSKDYYRILSVLELTNICFNHFLKCYLSDGLDITTEGKFSIYLQNISKWHCKFWHGLWTIITSVTEYTIMMYCVERCLAIMLPLRSRAYLQSKTSYILWILLVLPPSLYLGTYTSSISNLLNNSTIIEMGNHKCDFFYAHISFLSYCISSCGIRYTIHIVVVIICNILIMRKLKSSGHERFRMTMSIAQAHRSNRILKSSKILLIISSIQGVIYFPALVVCVTLCGLHMASAEFQTNHSELIAEFTKLYFLTNSLTLTNNICHFFVYLLQIPSFRNEFVRIIHCHDRRHRLSDSRSLYMRSITCRQDSET